MVEFRPDLVCYLGTTTETFDECLYVDHSLLRIRQLNPRRWQCCDLADLSDRFSRILVLPGRMEPDSQLAVDAFHAARLLARFGEARFRVPSHRRNRSAATLRRFFRSVHAWKTDLVCRRPKWRRWVAERRYLLRAVDLVPGQEVLFTTRDGLFSPRAIDAGTALLVHTIGARPGARVLDVGCGYGAVGIAAALRGARVTMLDQDARAVALVEENRVRNRVEAQVLLDCGLGRLAAQSFDLVACNPPTHGGTGLLQRLIEEMRRATRRGGEVLLVIGASLDYGAWLVDSRVVLQRGAHKILSLRP